MRKTDPTPRIELEGAADAPILVFDQVPLFGVIAGMGRVTLSAVVQDEDSNGKPCLRRIAVAHLRGNALAFAALREALDKMELMSAGPTTPKSPMN